MKMIFIIAGSFMEYRHCKGRLMRELNAEPGDFRHLTDAGQLDSFDNFTLVKTGTWFKNKESVKLVAYAEARLEELEARREIQKEKAEKMKPILKELNKILLCNCDLDRWEPEKDTGHSRVCRIHKAAKIRFNRESELERGK